MSAVDVLLKPEECGMLFVDFQAGRGFGVGLAYARDDSSRMIVSKD
jgi:hypothetical protein